MTGEDQDSEKSFIVDDLGGRETRNSDRMKCALIDDEAEESGPEGPSSSEGSEEVESDEKMTEVKGSFDQSLPLDLDEDRKVNFGLQPYYFFFEKVLFSVL